MEGVYGKQLTQPLPVEETAARRRGGGCVWETVAPNVTCRGNSGQEEGEGWEWETVGFKRYL